LIDAEMKLPSSVERGKRIAKITNFLELQNDITMRLGLDYGFKKVENLKKKLINQTVYGWDQ